MENSSDFEEATFTTHGIILEKDFPPIKIARFFFPPSVHPYALTKMR